MVNGEWGRIRDRKRAARGARSGWESAAQAMRARGEDRLLDEPTPTRFDEESWQWQSQRGGARLTDTLYLTPGV